MSQKSKLRRKQRNQSDREDDPQPGRQYGDAAEYFEQMRLQWEAQNKKSPREG